MEVVGVMPAGFRVLDTDADLILPLRFDRSKLMLPGFGFQGIARLKPGVTIQEADADIGRMVPIWMNSWPAAKGVNPRVYEAFRITPALRSLHAEVVGNVGDVLWIVMATIGIVLLVACANVATCCSCEPRDGSRSWRCARRWVPDAGASSAACCSRACCWR